MTIGAEGAFASLEKPAVFVDHTTASATIARELNAIAKARGFGFLDAPISGGQAGAETGALSVMCGGAPEDYARAEGDHLLLRQGLPVDGTFGRGPAH